MTRQPSAKLFPTEDPVGPGELIGREEAITDLAAQLEGGMHRVIASPRRTGKTTLCEAVLERLREQGFYTVAVDLWEVEDQVEFAATLIAKTIANRSKAKRLIHDLRERGREVSRSLRLTSTQLIEELGQEIEIAWRPSLADRDPRRYARFALRLPSEIAKRDDCRVVVFFDEFQNVRDLEQAGHGKDPTALQKLMRSTFQRSPGVTFLFAGSLEHIMRDIFAPEKPLGYFGGSYELPAIAEDAWRQGIRERMERDGTEIADEALDRLLERSEQHPRITMLLAQHAHQISVTQDVDAIDAAIVRAACDEAQVAERPKHEQIVDRIRGLGGKQTRRLTLKIAKAIARREPIYVRGRSSKEVSRAAKALQDAGIVESLGRGRGWRIVDPLLRRYLASMDPIERP